MATLAQPSPRYSIGRRSIVAFLLGKYRRASPLKLTLYVLLVGIAIVPMIVLILGSLMPPGVGPSGSLLTGESTLENYAYLFASSGFQEALKNTVISSALGAVFSIILGCWLAFLSIRTDIPFKGFITIVSVVPFFVSAFVHAFAWSALADPQVGIVNLIFNTFGIPLRIDINTIAGVAFVQGLYHTPFVFLFVSSALFMVDPSLEEASRTSGATIWQTVRRVTLPLVVPAIFSSGVLVFALMAGNFAIPSLLGTPAKLEFVTTTLYRLTQFSPPKFGEAAAAGAILMTVTFGLFVLQRVYVRRRSYLSVTGKGFRPRLIKLGKWKPLCVFTIALYALVVILIPLAALILRSSRPYFYLMKISDIWDTGLMSWANFELLFEYSQVSRAIVNTTFLSIMTAVLGGMLFFLIAYGAERMDGKGSGSGLLRYLAVLPSAIPGMVLGLSYLWVALYLPLPLYGTIWVLLISFLARFTPQGSGTISSSLRSLHPELEESARVAGAYTFRRMRLIVVPLAKQGILAAMVLCFVLAITELHTSILLYTSRTIVLSVVMYEFWQFGEWGVAAALSLIQSTLVVIVLFAAWKIFGITFHPDVSRNNELATA